MPLSHTFPDTMFGEVFSTMFVGYGATVSDVDAARPGRVRCLSRPSASMYFLMVACGSPILSRTLAATSACAWLSEPPSACPSAAVGGGDKVDPVTGSLPADEAVPGHLPVLPEIGRQCIPAGQLPQVWPLLGQHLARDPVGRPVNPPVGHRVAPLQSLAVEVGVVGEAYACHSPGTLGRASPQSLGHPGHTVGRLISD